MTEHDRELLERFTNWVATLDHDAAVRLCRQLSEADRWILDRRMSDDATAALTGSNLDPVAFEPLAKCLDVLADADTGDPRYGHAEFLHDTAATLRRAPQWRAEVDAENEQNRLSEGRLESLALAGSCWADEPTDARLRRIEEVLPRIRELADEARTSRREDDVVAIGEDITGLWRLRSSLESARDA